MIYEIVLSESAKTDLKDIYRYIYSELQVPETAKNIVRKILSKIDQLNEMPERYRFYPEEPMYSNEIRFFTVANYLVFYKVSKNKNTVFISRIIYGGRNIRKQLIEIIE